MTTAIAFLTNDVKLAHGNVCLESVMVNDSLDWKVFMLDHMVRSKPKHTGLPSSTTTDASGYFGGDVQGEVASGSGPVLVNDFQIASQYKPSEVNKGDWQLVRDSPPWCV